MNSLIEAEQQALEMRSALTTVVIADQQTYDAAVTARTEAKEWLKGAEGFFDGLIKPTYAAYKNALDTKKKVLEPVEQTVAAINLELLKWDNEQTAKRLIEQRRLEEEARAEAERMRQEDAKHLEAAGASAETVEAVLAAPVQAIAPVVAEDTYEKSKSIVYRDNWTGECFDLHALVKAVARDRSKLNLLSVNTTALNQLAKALKETMSVPGCRAVNKRVVASGRG